MSVGGMGTSRFDGSTSSGSATGRRPEPFGYGTRAESLKAVGQSDEDAGEVPQSQLTAGHLKNFATVAVGIAIESHSKRAG